MNTWITGKKFNETSIPPKEAFNSELNLEDITDEDHTHVQKVWDVFEIKNRGEYHDLYVQSDTLLLADVFENFKLSVLKYMGLILLIFVSTWISMASLLKKDRSRIRIINRY